MHNTFSICKVTSFSLLSGHHQIITGIYHLEISETIQVSIHAVKTLKKKLPNFNANVYFNQKCLCHNLILNYAKIRSSKNLYSIKLYP
jgi:hypothetical protein